MRMPFNRTGAVNCSLPSSNSCALRSSDQPVRQRPCLHATLLIEFAELRHRLLNDPTTNTHAAHKAPIAMNLPILAYRGVAQIHAPELIRLVALQKIPLVGTTRPNPRF